MIKKLTLVIVFALISAVVLPTVSAEAQSKYKGKACGNSSGWC